MKRYLHVKSVAVAMAVLVLPLVACGQGSTERKPQGSEASDWPQPPSVSEVVWRGNLAGVSGVAAPSARVVFGGEGGEAYAVTADAQGQFMLWIEVPEGGLLLYPRVQVGQVGVEGQGVMFLARQPEPVAAILFAGEGAYRLGHNGALDAVDTDGEALIVSGHLTSERPVSLLVNGQSIPVIANDDGRWAVVANSGSGSVSIAVDGKPYRFTDLPDGPAVRVYTESGWFIRRDLGGEAVQTTWLPADK